MPDESTSLQEVQAPGTAAEAPPAGAAVEPSPPAAPEQDDSIAASPSAPRARARGRLLLSLIPVAFLAGLGAGYSAWGVAPPATPRPEPRRYDVPSAGFPSLGPDEAPIVLIEFSDFNCPFCRRWHVETLPALQAAYPDQIRLVYRDLPVVGGGQVGFEAAQAAHCAGDQDAYWQYHDLLFTGSLGLSRPSYLEYAERLGLDRAAFTACLDDGRYAETVLADRAYALQLGVNSTPTFFLNGIPIVGAQPFEVFASWIDSELAR